MTKPSIRRLFVDIEVSPNVVLSWRVGNKLSIQHDNIVNERAIICIAYKWEGEDGVFVDSWDGKSDKAMLRRFAKVAESADELVAHNGDRYDIPFLRTRCLFHGIGGLERVKTVDTLKIAFRQFRFNSATLDYLGKFLGVGAKTPTRFDLWKRIVLDRDHEALSQMCEYCRQDVRLLEGVFHALKAYDKPKTHVGVLNGRAKWTCPRCGSENVKKSKTRVTSAGTVQHQMLCKDCGEYYTINDATFREYLKEKKGSHE